MKSTGCGRIIWFGSEDADSTWCSFYVIEFIQKLNFLGLQGSIDHIEMKVKTKKGLPSLEKGQLWKVNDTHVEIVLVGKHLAHYKLYKNQKRVPTMLKAIQEIQEYLKTNKAELIESAAST